MSSRTVVRLVLVVLLTALGTLLALWLLYRLQAIVVWSILALFLAVALNPSVNWLNRHRVPRTLAILLMYLGVLVIVAAIAALVMPPLLQQGRQLVHVFQQPGGLTREVDRLADPIGLGGIARTLHPQVNAIPGQLAGAVGSLPTVTASTVSSVTALLSVAVLGFFFLHDGARLVEDALHLVPDANRARAGRLVDGSFDAIFGYIRGNLVISFIAGLSALLGMVVLGIPYALPLAVLLAVLDLVPMVGATLGAIPVVLAALSVSPLKALIILVYIVIYQQIESNVFNPLIYGHSDQLPALTVFLAFLAGSLLFGILGALIAIPVANIIRIIVREWVATPGSRTAAAGQAIAHDPAPPAEPPGDAAQARSP